MKPRKTTVEIGSMKSRNAKIAALTAYDYYHAKIMDECGTDIILVGDSLGMVFGGLENTLAVETGHIYYHAQAVARGAKQALLVADMPFLSYQVDENEAVRNCGRFIKTGVSQAVKIEGGGKEICRLARRLVQTGIPVMGHIGLTPQKIQVLGGYRTQGKTEKEAEILCEEALRLEEAGVFCLVLESIPAGLGKKITDSVSVPTIGIGAGPFCDGQILVISDILGMFDEFKPKFARRYGEIGRDIRKCVSAYVDDVRQNRFPDETESYS